MAAAEARAQRAAILQFRQCRVRTVRVATWVTAALQEATATSWASSKIGDTISPSLFDSIRFVSVSLSLSSPRLSSCSKVILPSAAGESISLCNCTYPCLLVIISFFLSYSACYIYIYIYTYNSVQIDSKCIIGLPKPSQCKHGMGWLMFWKL